MVYNLNGHLMAKNLYASTFVNTGFIGTGSANSTATFTATQVMVPQGETTTAGLVAAETARNTLGHQFWGAKYSQNDINSLFTAATGEIYIPCTGQLMAVSTAGTIYSSYSMNSDYTPFAHYEISGDNTLGIISAFLPIMGNATADVWFGFEGMHGYIITGGQEQAAKYMNVTGTTKPYPQYDTVTTGTVTINVTADGRFGSRNQNEISALTFTKSGNMEMNYYNGPDTTGETGTYSQDIYYTRSFTPFKDFTLDGISSNRLEDTGYTYQYGPFTTAYIGHEGL
jgi:hypothetical protein